MVELNCTDSLKMSCKVEHTERLPGHSGAGAGVAGTPPGLRQGPSWLWGLSQPQPGAGYLRGTDRGSPSPGCRAPPWDGGPRVGPARRGPWPGRAGLWGAGERPCCSVAGAGADGPGGLRRGPVPGTGWGESQGLRWGPGPGTGWGFKDSQGWQCPWGPGLLSLQGRDKNLQQYHFNL